MDKAKRLSYLVSLDTYNLSEDDTGWLHAFSLGSYQHPFYGEIKMTEKKANRMSSNILNDVRGIELAVDYGHNSSDIAAGWIRTSEVRSDGLWVLVEWTKKAAAAIRNKEFKYFSPEFTDAWTHPESGKKYKDVLFGGGLTNRPFLKNLVPVNLTEMFDGEMPENIKQEMSELGGDDVVELLKQLSEALSLSEDAKEEDVLSAIAKLKEPSSEDPEGDDGGIQSLAETHPEVKALVERVSNMEAAAKLTEVNHKIESWQSGNKFGLPATLNDSVKAFMLSADDKQTQAFGEFVDTILEKGLVTLTETAGGHRDATGGKDLNKIDTEIQALQDADDTLSYPDAVSQYFREDEDAFKNYMNATLGGDE